MATFLYQQKAEPVQVVAAVVVPSIDGWGPTWLQPSRVLASTALIAGSLFAPTQVPAAIVAPSTDWIQQHPQPIRAPRQVEGQVVGPVSTAVVALLAPLDWQQFHPQPDRTPKKTDGTSVAPVLPTPNPVVPSYDWFQSHPQPDRTAKRYDGFAVGSAYPIPNTTPAAALDLMAAIVAQLRATSSLVTAFGDSGSTPKFWADEAFGSPALPWLRITEVGGQTEFSSDGNYIEDGTIQVSVFSHGRRTARSLSNQIEKALNDAALLNNELRVMRFRRLQPSFDAPSEPGLGATVIYHRVLTFRYTGSSQI